MSKGGSSSNDKGIAQAIKDLSNPMSFTLNQRAAGSIPARPTNLPVLSESCCRRFQPLLISLKDDSPDFPLRATRFFTLTVTAHRQGLFFMSPVRIVREYLTDNVVE